MASAVANFAVWAAQTQWLWPRAVADGTHDIDAAIRGCGNVTGKQTSACSKYTFNNMELTTMADFEPDFPK